MKKLDVDGRIILEWIFKKYDEQGLDWSCPGWGQMAGWCGCSKEPSGSITCGEILTR
jgi:hypothetical protein